VPVVSDQARNLAVAIVSGLLFGTLATFIQVGGEPLVLAFLQNNELVVRGAYWQLITSMLVAPPILLGVVDVLFNAGAVVWLDGILSSTYSEAEYYAVFFFSGLLGNLLSLLNGPESSFGASGGIFGLLAGAVFQKFVEERRIEYGLLVWFLFIFIFSSFFTPYVDWFAHLGGSLFGILAGLYLGERKRQVSL
jgi:membrane associated rhomboid family serine protease